MNSSDSSASEHCNRQLHSHWHVDRYPIAFVHAVHFQDIREATNFLEQLAIRQPTVIIGMISFPKIDSKMFVELLFMGVL